MFRTDWSSIHEKKGFHLYTLPLAIMSFIYGNAVRVRNACMKNGVERLPGFVLSVGNITTGGTGKTPAVITFARWAEVQGYRVAILSRGYGGKNKRDAAIVSDGRKIMVTPDISGDEPWLMANSLENIPVVVSRKRYLAGQKAANSFGSNFFILDDGFQHIHLKRDMDILLADAENPFGNGHLLPWGPLREPLPGLNRADAIILTRAKNHLPEKNRKIFLNKPVFTGDHIPNRIYFPFYKKEEELSYLKGRRVMAFSGIARPASFKESLLNLGADIISFRTFGDHYQFNRKDIEELRKEQEALNAEVLVTTEKDWARIQGIAMDMEALAFLTITFVITSGKYELLKMVKEKADNVIGGIA